MKQSLRFIAWLLPCFYLLLPIQTVTSQRLNAPELSFTYACVSEDFNTFYTILSFSERIFNNDNTFILELSDANGSFADARVLRTISDQNFSFDFETSFSFPMDVAGEGYRLRVRATSPQMTSPATPAFHAFYTPNVELVLNNYKDITVCGGANATLTLNHDISSSYHWYRNGQFYMETGNSLTITESGEYYVEPNLGDCTGNLYSNIVVVNFGEEMNASINGPSEVEVCESTSYTFVAGIDNEFLDYRWFHNGKKIEGLPTYMPKLEVTVGEATYGTYTLTLVNEGGCVSTSSGVTLKPQENSVTVTALSPLETILLGDTSVKLAVSSSAGNSRVIWYKDDELYTSSRFLEVEVSEPGTYFARVTVEGSCTGVVDSPVFRVVRPDSITSRIGYANTYDDCINSTVTLEVKEIKAYAGDIEVLVPRTQFAQFKFSWSGNTGSEAKESESLYIASFEENGVYSVKVTYDELITESNTLKVQLRIPEPSLIADNEVICSNGGETRLSTPFYQGALYAWYYEGTELTDATGSEISASKPGTYFVKVLLNGCTVTSEEITIYPVNDALVTVFPDTEVFITSNSQELVSASGADSYIWKNDGGLILSSTDTFTASEEGIYYLHAMIDGCEIVKTIKVGISDVTEVPNIITPNQDNINDTWVLPARFINDPDVQVTICDTYGTPVLRTKQYQNNWPETSAGPQEADAAIFYYFIEKNGKALKKGSITVVNR
ncbi:gliding motility-associated C-terminal domain-containing protein [Ascidiimonas aurantiaca]|uniref:T9SS type B sorting domain-containing protein n=1 Tax=Ascidiimonas aurantiaca TaxID=1685432 RepID=UPI0030EBA4F3